MTADETTRSFPPHVWHDCRVHGHAGGERDESGVPTGYACLSCDNGLHGCAVCGQWEGMIRDQDRCIGANPNSADFDVRAWGKAVLLYHRTVASVLRPALTNDLCVGLFVAVRDAGTWAYAGRISDIAGIWFISVAVPDLVDLGPLHVSELAVYDPFRPAAIP